jgi:hypothetical protein
MWMRGGFSTCVTYVIDCGSPRWDMMPRYQTALLCGTRPARLKDDGKQEDETKCCFASGAG